MQVIHRVIFVVNAGRLIRVAGDKRLLGGPPGDYFHPGGHDWHPQWIRLGIGRLRGQRLG
jgi:hypothetical protein